MYRYVIIKPQSEAGLMCPKRILDIGLTDTYSTLADGRSCSPYCSLFGHTGLHSWSNRHVIPLQT